MFARPISRRAARIARSTPSSSLPTSRLGAVRHASGSIPVKKPPHRVAGGQNSLLVGSVVLGATLALGYAFGRGENIEHAGHKTLASAKADIKAAPSIVKKKLDEAKHTIPVVDVSDSSSSSSSSHKSTPPAVSATGASSPAPSLVEEDDDSVSVSSSVSDPGSISSEGGESEEDEDPRQAAFDPVTGEINWDCPCLGGMAHGVCGEQFREAFACFVYSKEEPKGQDCIEKFRGMQECFAEHPEVYGEVMGDDEEEEVSANESDYDIVSAVEKALSGDSKSE